MFFRYIGKSSHVISYGTILEQRDGLFEYDGYRFCCEKEKLQPLGDTLNCKALGYTVGDQFIALRGNTFYYAQGSTIELVEDDESSIPWFKYVSGPKGEDDRAVFAASLKGLFPLKGCGTCPVKTEEKPVKGPLYDAVFAVDAEAAAKLPDVSQSICDEHEQPSGWLRCGFLWGNTSQGREFWAEVRKKMLKAEADRERLVKSLEEAEMHEEADKLPKHLRYRETTFEQASNILFECLKWGITDEGPDFWQTAYLNLREIEALGEKVRNKLKEALVANGQMEAAELLPEIIGPKYLLEQKLNEEPKHMLPVLFVWDETKEGQAYWQSVNKKLNEPVAQKISMHRKYKTRSGLKVRILCVDSGVEDFPVIGMVSDRVPASTAFTADGKWYSKQTYENQMDLIEDNDAPFEKDDLVLVSHDGNKWVKRHYDRFEDGKHYAYRFGACSETAEIGGCETTAWPHVKRP